MAMDLTEGIKKLLLAGVGAVATTADKSQEIFDVLVKKGEITVEQGKTLNQELKHNVKEKKETAENPIKDINAMLAGLTAEQLEALKGKIDEVQNFAKAAAGKGDAEQEESEE